MTESNLLLRRASATSHRRRLCWACVIGWLVIAPLAGVISLSALVHLLR